MSTIKTPVHRLQPGDILVDPPIGPLPTNTGARYVVLELAAATPGPVGVMLGLLGPPKQYFDRVATASWLSDQLVDLEPPALTPAQAHADELVELVRRLARGVLPHPDVARALLDKLAPEPPTVEEVGRLLQELYSAGSEPSTELYDRVLDVLERLPRG